MPSDLRDAHKKNDRAVATAYGFENILDARKNYPQATLADLYDELSMPSDLRDAHKKNDRAVAAAYGFEKILDDESKIVGKLFKLYERLTS